MQLAPTPVRPPLAGLRLGHVVVENGFTKPLVTTDRSVGRRDGYATLEDARAAVSRLTRGEARDTAGIFAVDGRFFGQEIGVVGGSKTYPYDWEHLFLQDDSYVPYRQGPVAQSLVAMLDGNDTFWTAR